MRFERERFLGAGHYEHTPERHGYANGTRPKKIDTPATSIKPKSLLLSHSFDDQKYVLQPIPVRSLRVTL